MSSLGNKEIMAKNIKYYMELFGVDRRKITSDLNIKYTTFSDWLNAKTYPRIDKIELMANYFKISKSDLVEDTHNNSLSINSESAPLLSPQNINFANNQNYSSYTYIPIGVSAGVLKTIEGLSELPTIQLPDCIMGNYAGNTDVFIMHVNGDSMNRLFNDGDSIMCTPLPSFTHIENGDVVVVELHGEYTVKHFFHDQTNNRVILRPDSTNPIHTDIILSYEQAEELQLIGIVVMCCKYI